MKKLSVLLVLLSVMSCNIQDKSSAQSPDKGQSIKQPNIILLVGDGMGLTQISSLYVFDNKPTSFDRFNNIGLINTSSSSHKITDSAAGATAFACGKKSYNNSIGVDKDTGAMENIVEVLSRQDWNTGLVATSSITHATPAAFYAHARHRSMEEEIATQLVRSEVDLFIGGGLKFFSQRADGINYLDSLSHYGFKVHTAGLENASLAQEGPFQKRGFLMADNGMIKHSDGRGNYLKEASSYAIQELAGAQKSFFLMIEGSQIDWGGHGNDSDYIFSEMKDFDQAIHAALDFAEKDGNTLVIVTADHETGGYALSSGNVNGKSDYNKVEGTFSTGGHTAALIPVFAYGPGAERFKGIYQNSAIYEKMMAFVKGGN
jgi:alkaline phosphatase